MSTDPPNRDDDLEPLDPALGSLFAKERARGGVPAGAKARAWAKLDAAIGSGGGSRDRNDDGPRAGTGTGGALKLVAALAAGALLGGGAVALLRPPRVVYVDRPMPAAAEPSSAPVVVGLPTVVRGPETERRGPEPEPAASASASANVVMPAPSSSASNLIAERAILDEGRTALGRGDGQHALEATARHAREFPKGQLVEEREAIAIQALTKLRRCDEATPRGHRFEQRYPNSVLGPVVDAALAVCASKGVP